MAIRLVDCFDRRNGEDDNARSRQKTAQSGFIRRPEYS